MPIDLRALDAGIARLEGAARSATVPGADEFPSFDPAALVDLVVNAAHALFALSGVGVMLVDADDALRYVAASDEPIRALEQAQESLGEGPCLDSIVLQAVVATADLTTDPRYRAVGATVGPLGVRAVLGVPVDVAGIPVGSLNVYLDRPHEWPPEEVAALQAYARVLGTVFTALVQARRSDALSVQLQHALDRRIVVERAIGFLMAQRRTDAVAAFDILRRAARSSRRKVADVAAGVLDGVIPGPSRT